MSGDWLYIGIPIISFAITQGAKLAFDGIKGNLDIKHMWAMYGGMPSAHSAFVVSLSAYIGLTQGFLSYPFAIVAVLSALALRDAIGYRRQLGLHAKSLNQLIEKLPERERASYQHFTEQMGHSPLEVLVGSIFGLIIATLGYAFS